MFKKLITTFLTAAIVIGFTMPIMVTDAGAKGFRSSSSFSRSSFRSSSSAKSSRKMFSSYRSKSNNSSKKRFSTSKAKSTSSSNKKYATNKRVSSNKFTGNKQTSGYKKVGAGKQTRRAKSALRSQRAKFKKPSYSSTGKISSAKYKQSYGNRASYRRASSYDRSTYHTRRNQYYGGYSAPRYAYYGSPSYGMWDTIFLYSMLSSMNNNSNASQFAYNHQNDADYRQWRREANKQAQENAELRAQLAQMDAGASKYKGNPINADFIPTGVDADVAMSQEVLASQKPNLRVCVGSKNGTYFRVTAGVLMQGINSVNIIPVITTGTGEILDNVASGKCDAGFVQADGYWNYVETNQVTSLPFERVSSPYKEAVHLICNAKGPTAISKLSSKNKVWFPAKSGAAETWKNFIGEDSDYGKIQTVLTNKSMTVGSYEEAIMKVGNDKNSCAMYVGAPGASKLVRNIDAAAKKSNLVLIDINDNDLNDTTDPSGSSVYKFGDIDAYKQLNRQASCYGWCSGDIQSLYVNADFIVSNKWKKVNSTTYPSLAVDLMGMQPEIETAIRY